MSKIGERGISLLEVLLVLVIVSVLGSISFSLSAEALDNYRLEKAAKILLSDLRELHEKAVTENVWQQVKFYPSVNKYSIWRSGVWVEDVQLAKGIILESGAINISFYPTGIPSEGATIVLGNSRGKEFRVILAAVTGRVRLSS